MDDDQRPPKTARALPIFWGCFAVVVVCTIGVHLTTR